MSTNILKRQRSKNINGKEVKIIALGALDGLTMARKLATCFIPCFKSLSSSESFDFMGMLELATDKLGEIEVNKIATQLFAGATVDDFPLNVDDYFAANYGEFVDFMVFAIKENFGSFFKAEIAKGV
ncbi:phage tail assembly chaperone [Buttiauxella noackiae]|uniref:phage tail assembly chaperone n=1 Tax=Buttiauxella noackiae TaxID=82992 RepID=UPI00054D3945|nr:hypothetical protein [Buttiauxella noackiae]